MLLEMSGRVSIFGAGIVAAVGLSASCQKEGSQTAWWQSERERIELDQELALKKFRMEKLALNDFKQLEVLRPRTWSLQHRSSHCGRSVCHLARIVIRWRQAGPHFEKP